MPKGRMLNKKISYDEDVALLSLPAVHLYTWCIPHLDIRGRIYADPQILKGVVVPYVKELSPTKIGKCIQEMVDVGLVNIYGNDKRYMEFKGFIKNQNLREDREAESEIPDPTPEQLQSNSRVTPAEVRVKLSKDKLSKDKYSPTPDGVRLSKLLLDLISKRQPKFKEPDIQKWAVHIDRMIRIDKRIPEEIEKVITWCQENDFWQNNILSTEKLRKQFDQLELKMKQPKKEKWIT